MERGLQQICPKLTSGLGNRLFQFACAAGFAERWGRQLVFDLSNCTECPHGAIATLFRMYPHVPIDIIKGGVERIKEGPTKFFMYDKDTAEQHNPVYSALCIEGFRQNPRYFPKDVQTLFPAWDTALGGYHVRKWLQHDAGLSSPEEQLRTVSLHMRLGDYKNLPHHQQNLTLYYERAIERVPKGYRLHIFSDEPHLCRQVFAKICLEKGLHFTAARVRADIETLYEMTLCRAGNITANSTFSWWGAWFAHYQMGSSWATYPSKWGKGLPDPAGVIPEWGICIPVE